MGREIHFTGKLASVEHHEELKTIILQFAEVNTLPVLLSGTYPSPASEFPETWSPPLPGIFIHPGATCDSLVFEFDKQLYVRGSCSTALADKSVHGLVLNLLEKIKPCFAYLTVTIE